MNLWTTFLPLKHRQHAPQHDSFLTDPIRPYPPPPHKLPNMSAAVVPNLLIKLKAYRYRAKKKGWKHIHLDKVDDTKCPSQVRIITWNISFDMPGPIERLNAALRHLEMDVVKCRSGEALEPCCILLQELHKNAFPLLLADQWIRDHFVVTPRSDDKWPPKTMYGNVTLASRSIPVVDCSIMHFGSSIYQRTGVIVDIRLKSPARETNGDSDSTSVVRIINTHLESMPTGQTARRMQLDVLSKLLFVGGERCGGVIAGDMNAIGPNEHEYPTDLGLQDAWDRPEDAKEGHTWGYQAPSQFPAARLDKVLFLPLQDYNVDEPKQVGVGIAVKDPVSGSDGLFVSDHYGLDSILRMTR
ncbi:hypothetical protein AX15_004570 [Amanita polypyramis BW_CC]|nr:hypothetical protein AX15_004570 [Amanita polypyramis BW_CC]